MPVQAIELRALANAYWTALMSLSRLRSTFPGVRKTGQMKASPTRRRNAEGNLTALSVTVTREMATKLFLVLVLQSSQRA